MLFAKPLYFNCTNIPMIRGRGPSFSVESRDYGLEKVKHSALGPSVSTPKLSLFSLQQPSLTERLAKVILGEMFLDLKKKQ